MEMEESLSASRWHSRGPSEAGGLCTRPVVVIGLISTTLCTFYLISTHRIRDTHDVMCRRVWQFPIGKSVSRVCLFVVTSPAASGGSLSTDPVYCLIPSSLLLKMADKEATVYIVDVGKSMGERRNGRKVTDLEWAMQYVWDCITSTVRISKLWVAGHC